MTEGASSLSADEVFPWARAKVDPPPRYAQLREKRPVTRVRLRTGAHAWLVSRYADVRDVLTHPNVSSDPALPGYPHFDDRQQQVKFAVSFLGMDPPDHTVYRRMFAEHFTVRRVRTYQQRIQALVDDTIDRMLGLVAPIDFVKEFALPIPSTVISWILGAHAEDAPFFNQAAADALEGGSDEANARSLAGIGQLFGYVDKLVADRAAAEDPGDDILGQLVQASREGVVDRAGILGTGLLFVVAGHDTTATMTAMGLLALLSHPDQLEQLTADPSLIPNAIEELLRYLSAVDLIVRRVALEDIDIGGVRIPAGDGIVPLLSSANRDLLHYEDPDTFDIHRKARDHLAFGFGVHQCLGQSLARLELQIIFETLLRRVPTLRLAAPIDEIEFRVDSMINGVAALPVAW